MKVIQIEHPTLDELVIVFLEITKGSIPTDTTVLLASASHMAVVGTAEYAIDFVCANMWLRAIQTRMNDSLPVCMNV
jgi:hypothetical protein